MFIIVFIHYYICYVQCELTFLRELHLEYNDAIILFLEKYSFTISYLKKLLEAKIKYLEYLRKSTENWTKQNKIIKF